MTSEEKSLNKKASEWMGYTCFCIGILLVVFGQLSILLLFCLGYTFYKTIEKKEELSIGEWVALGFLFLFFYLAYFWI